MLEQTLSIIKPDAVSRGIMGEIIKKIENVKLSVIAMKMIHMNEVQAKKFYFVHEKRHFFKNLVEFMISGPLVVMVLQGNDAIKKYRDIMGVTNFKNAAEGTIRREFATDIEKNVVHGSDGIDSAKFEISFFFNIFEIHS